jgi:hypothetical protein
MTVSAPRLWIPLSLRRSTLLGFAFLYASLAVIVGILYHFSTQDQGLASPAHRYHYIWTYFPSTAFIIISGFWYLVESNSKLLAPWRSITNHPATIGKSLRLDYSSEFRYVTLFSSLKNAHWDVFLAVVGTFSLNIIILLSTGLLTVQPRTIIYTNTTFTLDTIFNGTSTVQIPTTGLLTTHGLRYGLDFPNGTTPTFAYQSINTINLQSGSTARIQVEAFYPRASCVNISGDWTFGYVQYRQNMSRIYPGVRRKLNWPGCEQNAAWGFKLDPGLVKTAAGFETYSLSVVPNPCEGALTANTTWAQFGVLASSMTLDGTNITSSDARKRYVQSTPTNNTKGIGEDVNGDGSVYFKIDSVRMLSSKISGVVCTTSPQMGMSELSFSRSTIQAAAIPGDRGELNPKLGWQLQRAMYTSLANDAQFLTGYNSTPYIGDDLSLEKYSAQYAPFFQLLNDTNPRKVVKDFVDTSFLVKAVPIVMDRVAVQIASTDYFAGSEHHKSGAMSIEMDRLVVRPLSMGFILGLLVLMTITSCALCLWSEGVVTCNSASIMGSASLLADRPEILAVSQCLDTEDSHKSTPVFDKDGSLVTVSAIPEVLLSKGNARTTTISRRNSPRQDTIIWWKPWSALLPVSFMVLLLPCIGIALLEALLRLSKQSKGIVAISGSQYVQYAWVYVPVLVIFSLNSLFDAISSTNRTLQPYITMRERPSIASESIDVDLVNRATFSALYQAIKSRHLGIIAALLATIFGWTLPIAASSLYSVQNMQQSSSIAIHQSSYFDPVAGLTSSLKAHDNFLPLPGLILYNNLSYPQWTHGKYAFPRLELAKLSANQVPQVTPNASLHIELPAVYAVANCTLQTETTWSSDLSGNRTDAAPNGRIFPLVTLSSKTPAGCPALPCDLMTSSDEFQLASWKSITEIRSLNSFPTSNSTQKPANISSAAYHGKTVLPAHCPRSVMCAARGVVSAMYLNETASNTTSAPTLEKGKLMYCSPYVMQETVRVEFSLPDFDISPTSRPVPINGTRKFFSEAELINTADLSWYLPTRPFAEISGRIAEFDNFFQAVLTSNKGVDPVGVANNDAPGLEALYRRVDEVYGMVVAQVYSEKRRFATSSKDSTFMLNGTLIATTSARMVQDEVSTRIIQAVLAVMIICALGTILFTDGRRILPDRPCSIATIAGLLARSTLLGERAYLLDEDWKYDNCVDEARVRYSLGWRGELRSRWYGIDVGKADMFE